jgi:tRNA nucleotidyltransferase (CCA-adding enzyme)
MSNVVHPIPSPGEIAEWLGPTLVEACRRIAGAGGGAWLVGGAVRDLLLGRRTREFDFEVRGLPLARLRSVLAETGAEVLEVGRSFGVLRLRHVAADFALPRRDSRHGRGHRGIRAEVDPQLDPEIAARRRDLTVNAISLDPLTGELSDPLNGLADLQAGRLRACDPATFGEDPLRALRVMQLGARLEMDPDEELLRLCAAQDISELSPERVLGEFRRLLVLGAMPSRGLRFLELTGLLRFFPPLAALVGVPQDPHWHPEGDVWVHTLLVVDEAAKLRDGGPDDLALMFAALCHDFGKATTTVIGPDGRIRSPAHDVAGEQIAREFLSELRAPSDLIARVRTLTREHLAPAVFYEQGSSDRAWRRLARRMSRTGTSMELLARLARADHLGRTTEAAISRSFPAGEAFLERARKLEVDHDPPADVVQGRHLLALGMKPGREIGEILDRCRCVQDETGWKDPERILDRVLRRG